MTIHTDLSRDAHIALGNAQLAKVWLESASPLYGGQTPSQAMTNPAHLERISCQLKWISGHSHNAFMDAELWDVLTDPIINLALASAGSSQQELLALCNDAKKRKRAA